MQRVKLGVVAEEGVSRPRALDQQVEDPPAAAHLGGGRLAVGGGRRLPLHVAARRLPEPLDQGALALHVELEGVLEAPPSSGGAPVVGEGN